MYLYTNGKVYHPFQFSNESDFESRVCELADTIFGAQTIYLNIKKRLSGSEFTVIPDGFLVDMTVPVTPKLFIVENEIVSHDPFKHIGIQLLKFSINFEDSQTQIRNLLMKHILDDPAMKARLEQGCSASDSRNIDAYLDRAVYDSFKALVIIDEARPELYKVLQRINANISVLELKAYKCGEEFIYEYDTLYDGVEDFPVNSGAQETEGERARQIARLAGSDTIIVPAKGKGFQEVFLGENRWYAIRISAAMKARIRYIAAYQVAPESAITYMAEVKEIRPYEDTGKYIVEFKAPAEKLARKIPVKESRNAPQSPIYVRRDDLLNAKHLEDALHA